jgi:hypothetical protein
VLNCSVLDDRWHRDAPVDFVQRVVQRRSNVNLIRTILFAKLVAEQRRACHDSARFIAALVWVQQAPPGAVSVMMGSPSYDHWVYLADNVRRRYERAEATEVSDLPSYPGHFGEDRVACLMQDFGRFVAELAILTKTNYCGHALEWDGFIPLGLFGASVPTGYCGFQPFRVSFAMGRVAFAVGDREWDVTDLSQGTVDNHQDRLGLRLAGRVHLDCRSILVSGCDPLVQREWIRAYTNPDGTGYLPPPRDLSVFLSGYQAGLDLLHKYWPSMAHDVAFGAHTIVPVGRPGPDRGVSCTSDTFFGAILCCDNPPVLAAEVLIHEFGHSLFNEMLARDKVFDDEPSNEPVVYSPWREDPRPVVGCFHAAFVFERVSQFYSRYVVANPQNEAAAERFRTLLGCLRIACGHLRREGGFGAFGWSLLESISDRAERLATDQHARLTVVEKAGIAGHFLAWSERNPQLAARNAFALPD